MQVNLFWKPIFATDTPPLLMTYLIIKVIFPNSMGNLVLYLGYFSPPHLKKIIFCRNWLENLNCEVFPLVSHSLMKKDKKKTFIIKISWQKITMFCIDHYAYEFIHLQLHLFIIAYILFVFIAYLYKQN